MIEPCARQTSENGSDQFGPYRSRTVNAAWIGRCDLKVQSVTIKWFDSENARPVTLHQSGGFEYVQTRLKS